MPVFVSAAQLCYVSARWHSIFLSTASRKLESGRELFGSILRSHILRRLGSSTGAKDMKQVWITITTTFLVALLVLLAASGSWWFFGRNAGIGVASAQERSGIWPHGWGGWDGMGMMGRSYDGDQDSKYIGLCWGWSNPTGVASGETLTIERAAQAVEEYIVDASDTSLELDELMEFSRNFYAIVKEEDTGIGAMELLIYKETGVVGPEYGPNMMWNAKYGMHGGGMMGGSASATMTVSPEEAVQIAQRWLDNYRPNMTADEHADQFYGYYTIHTLRDGEISGMLSVHGDTGQVWYHNWHGDFVRMIGEHE